MVSGKLKMPFKDVSKLVKSRKHTSSECSNQDASDSSSKMPTKGALKVFEGLKVSIPTEELNLDEVLNNSPPIRKSDAEIFDKQFPSPKCQKSSRKSKPIKNKQQVDARFIFKVKKKVTQKDNDDDDDDKDSSSTQQESSDKIADVYDFEETQDNTDVFAKPDFKHFRSKGNENPFENNFEPQTLSSSSSSSISFNKKPKQPNNECITKKKHMIVGRIFKNVLKPKIEDDIKELPTVDHQELVENYVQTCDPKADAAGGEEFKKPKMTEEEMNYLFDRLLEKPSESSRRQQQSHHHHHNNNSSSSKSSDAKNSAMRKKMKMKNKKRQRTSSDSTDDEFGLNKMVKRRPKGKNAKEEDNSINLEQELKECIGVASRKSQRKCTSGKQNVLVEYWSSDESSAFENFLENHLQELSAKSDLPDVVKTSVKEDDVEIAEKRPETVRKSVEKSSRQHKNKIRNKIKQPLTKETVSSEIITLEQQEQLQQLPNVSRRKRSAAHPLYHWSSSSEDESNDLIEVKSIRDDPDDEYDEEDRPIQHGWIVGDSPKKLVTMLAQAKGKKTEPECSVKEQGKKKNSNS